MNKSSFTLIELVIVLLIVGILAVVSVTEFTNSSSAAKLGAAEFKLKCDITYAQALAVTQQVNHGVIFDPANETYSIYRQNIVNIIDDPLRPGHLFSVDFSTDKYLSGLNLVSTSFGAPTTNRVEFNSWGIPSDGTTALVADGSLTINYNGVNKIITVVKNTGCVR